VKLAPITFGRSDFNSFLPLLKRLAGDTRFETELVVSGTHLLSQFGNTIDQIEAHNVKISHRVSMPLHSDSPTDFGKSIGIALTGFCDLFSKTSPDLVIIVGDRVELLAAATAALAFRIPVAHISGGDVTEGAIDNQVRNAITCLSHLHFVAMGDHARRVRELGEEPWRIHITGEPALDLLKELRLLSRNELENQLELALQSPVVVVSYHPTTLSSMKATAEVDTLLQALKNLPATFVFTAPNADVERDAIVQAFEAFVLKHERARLFASLGPLRFYSLLANADLMIGNSSSGIWEAPSFKLPVVNVGDRQKGRHRARNVIDTGTDAGMIRSAIDRALQTDFRSSLSGLTNPYGSGDAVEKIVNVLGQLPSRSRLLRKQDIGSK
jgi:GDP/UDP-N,N'-diacetylbacillosamine 2-epimerase (hydrolysing)